VRRLVVCCDGTWDTPAERTNVSLVADALAQGPDQVVRYVDGVGTGTDPISRLLQGGLGLGLNARIREAYTWLAQTWQPGDEIVLLGFSRGAYTVRSLAGMLAACGLVAFGPDDSRWRRARLVRRVFLDGYQRRRPLDGVRFAPGFGPHDTAPILFLGVWDTVGALGIPRTFGLLSTLLSRRIQGFHDLRLAPDVRHARQALALDERRGPFQPAVWAVPDPGTHESFVQLWFPGTHGDVGGSQDRPRALSDITLRWMSEEATTAAGLTWRDAPAGGGGDPLGPLDPGPHGVWRYLGPRPRSVPRVVEGAPDVHASAVTRRAAALVPPYRPGHVPEPGVPAEAVVPADDPWSETGLYLPEGRYTLATGGTWSDHGAATTPAGFARWPWRARPDYALGAVLVAYRRVLRRLTSRSADSLVAPRLGDARRMALLAAVANDLRHVDGSLEEGTLRAIAPDGTTTLELARPGYLYAAANDSWIGYGGNRGAATLTVSRS
jgi:hypothetical protein